jgi:CBS domain containing-hemolysin-like protein
MKGETQNGVIESAGRPRRCRWRLLAFAAFAIVALPSNAHASLFHGETLDAVANVLSWVVLIIVPVVGIGAFWIVHILPEKIAEKKRHPQTRAIQCLCLLSLVFGGLLWPIAWLWAYTKPVLHKLAYGTDVDEGHGHDEKQEHAELRREEEELANLRTRVAELETEKSRKSAAASAKS